MLRDLKLFRSQSLNDFLEIFDAEVDRLRHCGEKGGIAISYFNPALDRCLKEITRKTVFLDEAQHLSVLIQKLLITSTYAWNVSLEIMGRLN